MEKSLNKPNWKFRFQNNVNLLLFSNKKNTKNSPIIMQIHTHEIEFIYQT